MKDGEQLVLTLLWCFQRLVVPSASSNRVLGLHRGLLQPLRETLRIQVPRRPFLLPRVKARRRKELLLLSSVGDLGLSLPDRWLCDGDDAEDSEADRSRPSLRMSSRETLR